ncbi:16S rRNA (adenine(1518)-N(6)/adenine(1519)-N(6))-dimethyltransferase RsmA [Nocardia zapadnayensis]|nr:16S rRNA (adenine(1518)-N(6)/adenine(1519)-N(6))-dimethyltransferase RsmA [Nocardia zapadnayensis]MCX0275825.1 16S rRNA (adenine(1518)-N(6)/adenine(1519)-N(6))-dimethyltransferase RsmA [Nocardia zapadnayensis]
MAAELQLRPTKQRGQNFVIDPNTVRMIVSAACLSEPCTVAEVGPGLGSLTLGLLDAGHHVIAVEIDELLASRLPRTVAERCGDDAPFDLVVADALRVTELPESPELGPPAALVANLPYNVAVPVLLHFLETFPTIRTVLVMVQAEVADRLAAEPGSRTYGVPSVKARWYGTVSRAGSIGTNVFWPAPNVDSGLVRIERHADGRRTGGDPAGADPAGGDPAGGDGAGDQRGSDGAHRGAPSRESVFAAIDAAFAQRRKTLRAALSGWAGSPARAEEILRAAGIDPRARGEVLDIDDYVALAAAKETV